MEMEPAMDPIEKNNELTVLVLHWPKLFAGRVECDADPGSKDDGGNGYGNGLMDGHGIGYGAYTGCGECGNRYGYGFGKGGGDMYGGGRDS
jgi:hypothetical protein